MHFIHTTGNEAKITGKPGIIIKHACTASEFNQVHKLNYKTFVEEIPQHEENTKGELVDKFHHKNEYIIALENDVLVGMVCYNCHRPFSLEQKLPDLDNYLPPYTNLVEVRLLSVVPQKRHTGLVYYLLKYLSKELLSRDIDTGIISGTTRQLKLYKSIGFVPFGPLVGKPGALYQPMYITINQLRNDFRIN